MRAAIEFTVLSIDAWGEAEGGWTWNNSYKINTLFLFEEDLTPRKILARLRVEQ